MFHSDERSIDCATCIGSGTTACSDCVVTHLLANDDGPIGYVPIELVEIPRVPTPDEVAIGLFTRAGLLGATVEFVPYDVFAAHGLGDAADVPVVSVPAGGAVR